MFILWILKYWTILIWKLVVFCCLHLSVISLLFFFFNHIPVWFECIAGSTRHVWISQIQDLSQPRRLLHLQDQVIQFSVHRQQQIWGNLPPLLRVRITAADSAAYNINFITVFTYLLSHMLHSAAFSLLSRHV